VFSLERSLNWLADHGRGVDLARIKLLSGQIGADEFRSTLTPYQNPDGGFGQALEPDVRMPDSSVLATVTAIQLLVLCDSPASDPLVRGAMGYLETVMNREADAWHFVPANVDKAAHAPWWDFKDISGYMLNPRAEIVGYMYRWPEFFEESLRDRLAHDIAARVDAANQLEMHDLLSVDRLLQTASFPEELHKPLFQVFKPLALAAIETSFEAWDNYGLSPLGVVREPGHPLAGDLAQAIELNLEYREERCEEDGSWTAPWTWYGRYDEEGPEAEPDIRSVVTADRIQSIIAFPR